MNRRTEQIRKIAREVAEDAIDEHAARFVHVPPKQPKVTVFTFDANGNQSKYSFRGILDYPRIERETIGEGMKAVIVLADNDDPNLIICSKQLGNEWVNKCGWTDKLKYSYGWYCGDTELPDYVSRIKFAIAKWRETQWKPEVGKWAWVDCDEEFGKGIFGKICNILSIRDRGIQGVWVTFKLLGGETIELPIGNFRPLTKDDWIGDIGGEKCTAEYSEHGYNVWLIIIGHKANYTFPRAMGEKICADNHIPIKPYGYK